MAVRWRLVRAVGTGLGIFVGAVLLYQVWPSDEVRSAKIRKDFPDQNYTESQRQNALIMEILKEAAESDENWARKPFPSKSSSGCDSKGAPGCLDCTGVATL